MWVGIRLPPSDVLVELHQHSKTHVVGPLRSHARSIGRTELPSALCLTVTMFLRYRWTGEDLMTANHSKSYASSGREAGQNCSAVKN